MQIIFATDNEPLSRLIRAVTNCRWHHVGVIFDDMVIEARFTGVMHVPLDEVKARGEYEVVGCPVRDEAKAKRFALAQVGKKYDMAGLLSFPLRVPWQDPRRWYCSELVAAVASAGGTPLVRDGLAGVSPRDLWVVTK